MNDFPQIEGVVVVEARAAGPTVAIFGGVHGDEWAGVEVIRRLQRELVIDRGRVYLVVGNPRAVQVGTRFTASNLNRSFRAEPAGTTYEQQRARELLPILDQCAALLDLHEHKDDSLGSFLICEPPSFEVAEAIGAPVISYGWAEAEPGGTDGYMALAGNVGICHEAGPLSTHAVNVNRHGTVVERFLAAAGVLDGPLLKPLVLKSETRYVKALRSIIREHSNFSFVRDFRSFEPLPAGEVFARDGNRQYTAAEGEVIIFPRPTNPISTEACVIGTEVDR